jgi:type VI secretion system protein ImpB
MPESIQHKLSRVRPPRVQITYDVEIGDAIQKKELPFVVGIISDLSGKQEKPLPKLRDRKFVEIDRDNFDGIMKSVAPRVELLVPDKLSGKSGKLLPTTLVFRKMDDFSPLSIVKQVPQLKELLDARARLNDLVAKLDGNDDLDAQLQEKAKLPDALKTIKADAPVPAEPAESEHDKTAEEEGEEE